MKAVLPYNATAQVRRLVEAAATADVRIVLLDEADRAGLLRELADAQALLHVLSPVTAEIMREAPRLRLVQKIGVGVDAIDRAYAAARGIAVCNMPGTNTVAVAELTLALMFDAVRRVSAMDRELRAGHGWPADPVHLDGAAEIAGSTVGLVGYGAVAQRLRPVLEALDAKVVTHTRRPTAEGIANLPLEALFEVSDIVSLHLPLNGQTRGIVDARMLGRMKPGAVLVNTARGALVDEAALIEALSGGRLAAAGLDVFVDEPVPADSPLLRLPNVVATPHVAWMTAGTWRRSLSVAVENCRRLAAGDTLVHRVEAGTP